MSPHVYLLRYPGLWWFGGASLVALVIYGSLATGGVPVPVTLYDKAQHLIAYSVLGAYFGGIVKNRALWLVLFLLLLMSIVLEFLQGAGGVRTFEVYDMVFNGAGLALGWVLCRLGLAGWCLTAERLVLA